MKTQIKQTVLENGLKIVTGVFPHEEIVSGTILVEAGARYEAKEESGWAHLLEHMLIKGSDKYQSDKEIYEVIDQAGSYFNLLTNTESVRVVFQVHQKEWQNIFNLACEIVRYPNIKEDVLENEKKVIYEEIRRSKNQYHREIFSEIRKKAFPNSLIANEVLGTEESLKPATKQKLHRYHQKWFVPNRTTLVFTGGEK